MKWYIGNLLHTTTTPILIRCLFFTRMHFLKSYIMCSFFLFKILCLAIRLSVYGCFFLRTFKHDAHCTLIAFYIPVLLSKFAITILSLKYCNFEPIDVYLINVFAELYSVSDAYIKKVFYSRIKGCFCYRSDLGEYSLFGSG